MIQREQQSMLMIGCDISVINILILINTKLIFNILKAQILKRTNFKSSRTELSI